jgi:hypothetical protein
MRMTGSPPILSTAERLARALADGRDVAVAWAASWIVEASVAVVGLKKTIGWMERVTTKPTHGDAQAAMRRSARAVRRAYRVSPFEGTCLRRSLVRYWLGRRGGLPVELVIGVKPGASFGAHAWIEPGTMDDDDTAPDAFSVILRTRKNGGASLDRTP